MNNLKSLISGTSDVVFSIFFCSNIAALKTSFWACPLKTDHIKLNACDVYSLEAHLEVDLLAAFLKKRLSTLIKSFISGTSDVIFYILYCSNIDTSKTSFWARRLKTDKIRLNTCGVYSLGAHLEVFFRLLRSWRNAYRRSLQLENNTKVLKVRQISVYALTVRLSLWISDLVHEVSVRQQRLRDKEEWNGTWVP